MIDLRPLPALDPPATRSRSRPGCGTTFTPAFADVYGIIGHKGFSDGYRLLLQENTNRLQFALPAPNGNSLVTTGVVGTGAWHHVVATYDGATMRAYIDGVPDPTTLAKVGNIIPAAGGDAEVYIGAGDQPKDRASDLRLRGQIDEVRLAGGPLRRRPSGCDRVPEPERPRKLLLGGAGGAGSVRHPPPHAALRQLPLDRHERQDPPRTGNASVALGSRIVSLAGGASLPANVGTGDAFNFTGAPAETLYIQSRDSATQGDAADARDVRPHEPDLHRHPRLHDTRRLGDRAPGEPRDGEPARGGRRLQRRLLHGGREHRRVDDRPRREFPMLTVASGQRHNGTAGTGVVLDGVDTDQGIRASTSHLVIDGFEFRRNRNAGGAVSVVVQNSAHDVLLRTR